MRHRTTNSKSVHIRPLNCLVWESSLQTITIFEVLGCRAHTCFLKPVWKTCGVCIPGAEVLIWFSSPDLAESCGRIHMQCCKHWLLQAL